MKSLVKPVILASMVSSLGLFCSLSSAEENIALPVIQQSDNSYSPFLDVSTSKYVSSNSIRVYSNKIADNKPKENFQHTCGSKKKNEIYELTAIFNDKLQMFLSYFGDTPSYQTAKLIEEPSGIGGAEITSP
ncbi:hypothetical protein [Thalassotalea fusca]